MTHRSTVARVGGREIRTPVEESTSIDIFSNYMWAKSAVRTSALVGTVALARVCCTSIAAAAIFQGVEAIYLKSKTSDTVAKLCVHHHC